MAARRSTASPTPWPQGSDFSWFRSRILGGRTNHYGRVTLRFADYDFKPRSRDGLGFDWPITYEDLSPYYDKAERFIGVTGSEEGIRSAPDGIFQPPGALKAHDVLVQRACAKLGIRAVPARQAVITTPTSGACALPLLRPVRTRLHDGVELRLELRADLSRDEDRPSAASSPTRWRASLITDDDREGDGRVVHRQDDRARAAGPLPHGGAGGERLRIGAAAAQFEVVAASAGPRELAPAWSVAT